MYYKLQLTQLGSKEDFDRSRVVLSDDSNFVKNAVLTLARVDITDTNVYSCTARNEATGFGTYTEAKTQTTVTVTSEYFDG